MAGEGMAKGKGGRKMGRNGSGEHFNNGKKTDQLYHKKYTSSERKHTGMGKRASFRSGPVSLGGLLQYNIHASYGWSRK
jgi:hypothetical protein